jgi:hypothetical protein
MNLKFKLPIGYSYEDGYVQDVSLLRINGAAEKIILERLPDQPYTWMGNVVACCIKEIGGTRVGAAMREEYLSDNAVTLPKEVLRLSIADINTCLVEIHRILWAEHVKNQESQCKYCGKVFITDIELSKIKMAAENVALLEKRDDWRELVCDLPEGFEYEIKKMAEGVQHPFDAFNGVTFNQFIFRMPTLADAIKYESYSADTVDFWRRIAASCLIKILKVDENGEVQGELPPKAFRPLGIKLFDEQLFKKDLSEIRSILRDYSPTLPFFYEEKCPHCKKQTAVSIEGSSFFSD